MKINCTYRYWSPWNPLHLFIPLYLLEKIECWKIAQTFYKNNNCTINKICILKTTLFAAMIGNRMVTLRCMTRLLCVNIQSHELTHTHKLKTSLESPFAIHYVRFSMKTLVWIFASFIVWLSNFPLMFECWKLIEVKIWS